MYNSADLLIKKLRNALSARGAKAEFCRKTGMSRGLLEEYLAGNSKPGLDKLDLFAQYLGVDPWELIAPNKPTTPVVETPRKLGLFEISQMIAEYARANYKEPMPETKLEKIERMLRTVGSSTTMDLTLSMLEADERMLIENGKIAAPSNEKTDSTSTRKRRA